MRSIGTDNRRILIVDDSPLIHQDYTKILASGDEDTHPIVTIESALFGQTQPQVGLPHFQLSFASSGEEAVELARKSLQAGQPIAVAFIDMRMGIGWDGVRTTAQLWRVDPNLQVAISTAYSDLSWVQIINALGQTDRLLFLKKPFDSIEVRQMALALTEKWNITRLAETRLRELENILATITECAPATCGELPPRLSA